VSIGAARFPDFFIVGAPKCGTTALFTYLADHPGIFVPTLKEPQWFSDEWPGFRNVESEAAYLQLFHRARPDQLIGEASAWYLYSERAVAQAAVANPRARFIAMLRNPVDMVVSLHGQLCFTGRETEKDFTVAWGLQEARSKGEAMPVRVRAPSHLQYAAVASFAAQVERLWSTVGRDRVMVILYDDFAADPAAVYRRTLDFLALPDDGRTHFPRVNEAKELRFERLYNLIRTPPWPFGALKSAIKRRLGFLFWKKPKIFYSVMTKKRDKQPLPDRLRDEMRERFRPDVLRLGTLLGRDLGHWLAP